MAQCANNPHLSLDRTCRAAEDSLPQPSRPWKNSFRPRTRASGTLNTRQNSTYPQYASVLSSAQGTKISSSRFESSSSTACSSSRFSGPLPSAELGIQSPPNESSDTLHPSSLVRTRHFSESAPLQEVIAQEAQAVVERFSFAAIDPERRSAAREPIRPGIAFGDSQQALLRGKKP